MRFRIAILVVKILLLIGGLSLMAAGIFAVPLGLDNDPGWGRGRVLLAAAGAIFMLAAGAIQFFPVIRERCKVAAAAGLKLKFRFQTSAFNQTLQRVLTPVCAWFRRNPVVQKLCTFWQGQDGFFAAVGVIIALLVAGWFFTTGRITTWSPGTDYFNRLADGFLAGQLSMVDEPSPELLAMPNPYDWRARIEDKIPFLWDATFFDGKYYLYWGPVPALIAAGVKIIHPGHIYDGALLFSFYAGIVILLALILRHLRRQFFPGTPAYLLTPLILMAGLSLPVLYLVIHPNVYETAISSGQFFLLGGFYCLLRAMERHHRPGGWLLAAGFSFGAAVSSRMTLVFAVGILVLIYGTYALKSKPWKQTLGALILLGTPLALWAVALGWYNWARFGSVFETGWRYQLTGPALPTSQGSFFSLAYILPNLYSYFIQLPVFTPGQFPFLATHFRSESVWPWFLQPPANYYYPEPIASVLILVPAVWLIGLPVVGWLRKAFYWIHEHPYPKRETTLAYKTVWAALLGASGMLFLPLTVFTSSSLRYLGDVLPFWSLLTAFSLWWGLDFLDHRPGLKRLLILLALILLTAGILFGFFGNFITGDNLFENRNLELYRKLGQFFQ